VTDQQSTQDTSTDTTNKDDAPDFAATLAQLAKGKTNTQLSEQLREVVAAVAKTKKNGKLQITINVKPQKSVEGAVIVSAVSKANAPAFEQPASIFYATDDGNLVRDDPHQQSLY